jgi:SAM-dependent methyltransferase
VASIDQWAVDQLLAYQAIALPGEVVTPWRIYDERAQVFDQFYFYQDYWAFSRVTAAHPDWLLDVGSTVLLVGLLSQFVPVVSVDIRPVPVSVPNLLCIPGNITALPFPDASVPMASSLSVIEHIGLGRYGDPLDAHGSERACRELVRVLRPGGRLLLSWPTADTPVTQFNANRLLPVSLVESWLGGCERVTGTSIDGPNLSVWCGEYRKRGGE